MELGGSTSLLFQLSYTFTNNLSGVLSVSQHSSPDTQAHSSPWSFMSSKPGSSERLLYHQVQGPAGDTTLAASGTQLLHAHSQETCSRRLHLSDAGLFLIIANFLAPGDRHLLSQKSKGFTLLIRAFC